MGIAVHIESWLLGFAVTPFRLPLSQLANSIEVEAANGAILPITDITELNLER